MRGQFRGVQASVGQWNSSGGLSSRVATTQTKESTSAIRDLLRRDARGKFLRHPRFATPMAGLTLWASMH